MSTYSFRFFEPNLRLVTNELLQNVFLSIKLFILKALKLCLLYLTMVNRVQSLHSTDLYLDVKGTGRWDDHHPLSSNTWCAISWLVFQGFGLFKGFSKIREMLQISKLFFFKVFLMFILNICFSSQTKTKRLKRLINANFNI